MAIADELQPAHDLEEREPRLSTALALAEEIHAPQKDKASGVPYVVHPIRVANAVLDAGGTIEQAQAALLHDAIEDGGPKWRPNVREFGEVVAEIVRVCSDAEPTDGKKDPWRKRKVEHVNRLRAGVLADAYLVVAADKLDAVTRTLSAVLRSGDAFWSEDIFKGGRLGTVWYYRSMSEIVSHHLPDTPIAEELAESVLKLTDAAGLDGLSVEEMLTRATNTAWPEGIKAGEGGPS